MAQLQTSPSLLPPEGGSDRLRAYVHEKQAVARQIRAVERWLKQHNAPDRAGACHELMVKLAEDRFTLAVVGQFKRGKSSLMNAIIGRDLLPTGLLPVTSAITILRFGPGERLVISHENWSIDEEAPISALPEYVTEQANPGNRKGVKAVYVEVPSPFLRRGLEFVDTPGIGGPIEANTATTYRFLPQCDAVLFVTAADGPLAAAEAQFLQRIRQHVRKVFFLVNKMDLVAPGERQQVLGFIAAGLARQVDAAQLRLFALSSRLALAAKQAHDTLKLAESGLPALETALADFLAGERSATFLAGILDRAESLLAAEEHPQAAQHRTAIQLLRQAILSGQATPAPAPEPPEAPPQSPALAEPITPPRPVEESDLLASLAARGCPVCNHLSNVLFDFLTHWQHALAQEEAAGRMWADERGFCPLHTWQLAAVSSPRDLSVGYSALLERLSADLSSLAGGGETPQTTQPRIADLTGRSTRCRACRLLAEAEREYLSRLAAVLVTPPGRDAYSRSQGVCLRHLGPLTSVIQDHATQRLVLQTAAAWSEQLAEDMQSFAMKHDATRRYLQNRNETNAYLRALVHVAGHKSLCFPWQADEL